ncbi:D-2-hydroxyacid dehydrogenase [Thalassobaculum fulvum]|uniref:D-2-hydroxyacid dehydrogenase n=1 Tax=Thalassobaculum fulvum TaxID=1633335 RepID=A0A918XRY1_9PROT|nr:FAD-binding oxidoreductase [Thalassobaculum fulvum]GHD50701.1 D-2-hydroxyacid dehydrogenase [Thalassobaculum fulvum]
MAAPAAVAADSTAPTADAALDRIRTIVGPKGWTDDAEAMRPHLEDWRGLFKGKARMLVKPATTEEVAGVVAACHDAGIPIVPQGGNTSLCGASTPDDAGDGIVLSLVRMNRVRDLDADNYTLTVEAGCVLADVQAKAADADRYFPLSLAAEGSCMIGGNLSTNAGGTNVLKYGNARELVLGLEVVLPDGRIWNGLRGLRKDNTGYDLKQLFLGAEGTLGIITAAVLKLFPKPTDVRSAFCAVPNVAAAVTLLGRARAESGDAVETFEFMPRLVLDLVLKHFPDTQDPLQERYEQYVLLELVSTASGESDLAAKLEAILESAFEDGLVLDAAISQSEGQRQEFWKLRENASEAQKLEGASIKHDVSVPVSRIAEFYDAAWERVQQVDGACRLVGFGHVGDGNLHYNLQAPEGSDGKAFLAKWEDFNRAVHDVVVEMGGSISAEHGIGRLKREELAHYKDPVSLDLMRTLKAALDPKGIFNPGKVI